MTPTLTEGTDWQYEAIDVNIIPDLYVTWIVDIWKGDKADPATDVERYIGVWSADVLEDEEGSAVDPTFVPDRWDRGVKPSIEPLHWELLDHVKKADSAARAFRKQSEDMLDEGAYVGYNMHETKTFYSSFMEGLEVLVNDPDNEDAWAAVTAFRNHQAMLHEK